MGLARFWAIFSKLIFSKIDFGRFSANSFSAKSILGDFQQTHFQQNKFWAIFSKLIRSPLFDTKSIFFGSFYFPYHLLRLAWPNFFGFGSDTIRV
jgi:hypothetical protein